MEMTLDQPLYALHHVNVITGEVVRFERDSSPAMPRASIDGLVAGAQSVKSANLADGHWSVRALRDVRAELEIEGVPERIIHIVESMMRGREWGLCDPMYMSNRVAVKFGWGDGFSHFTSTDEDPDQKTVKEFAQEIHWSYITAFGEVNLSAHGVLGRVLGGLQAGAKAPQLVERPRG